MERAYSHIGRRINDPPKNLSILHASRVLPAYCVSLGSRVLLATQSKLKEVVPPIDIAQ